MGRAAGVGQAADLPARELVRPAAAVALAAVLATVAWAPAAAWVLALRLLSPVRSRVLQGLTFPPIPVLAR
jgi:hypothetical protein